jgi:hypothetical protein
MNKIFLLFLCNFLLLLFDDIFFYNKTWESCIDHVNRALQLMWYPPLFLKCSKFTFEASEVEFLGHIVSQDGVQVDPKKVVSIQYWPQSEILKILQRFLGLTSYYRKFMKNYGNNSIALTTTLKKNSFVSSEAIEQDFLALKDTMCTTLVLVVHDFTKSYVLECDASCKGLGMVLI